MALAHANSATCAKPGRKARAHARAGDPAMIAGYLGKSDVFDRAIGEFAHAYADRNEADHAALTKAVKNGKVRAETVSVQTSDKRVASGTAHKSRLRPGLARKS